MSSIFVKLVIIVRFYFLSRKQLYPYAKLRLLIKMCFLFYIHVICTAPLMQFL